MKNDYSIYKNQILLFDFDYFYLEPIYMMGKRLPDGYTITLYRDGLSIDSYYTHILTEQPDGIKFVINKQGHAHAYVIMKRAAPSKYLYDIDDLINNTK